MNNRFKLSIVLIALCLLMSIVMVACNDSEDVETEALAAEETTEATEDTALDSAEESESESEAATTEASTLGHASELGDDDFIKGSWGDCD